MAHERRLFAAMETLRRRLHIGTMVGDALVLAHVLGPRPDEEPFDQLLGIGGVLTEPQE
jgi:hypothetical protein